MKNGMKYLLVVWGMVMGFFNFSSAQELEQMPCVIENNAFLDGEELVYKLYYNWQFIWIPAGEVTFKVRETDETYEMEAVGTSYPSYDGFFQVRDFYYSSIDKETLHPISFKRDIEEGGYLRYDSVVFDRSNYMIYEHIGKNINTTKELTFSYDDCVQDMVSVMYFLRNIDDSHIQEGYGIPVSVFFDKEFFNMDINVISKGTKKIKGLGKQEVIHIAPNLVTGEVFKEGNELNIWVSDDSSKIPLLIESPVTVGSVKAILVSHTNTKDQFF